MLKGMIPSASRHVHSGSGSDCEYIIAIHVSCVLMFHLRLYSTKQGHMIPSAIYCGNCMAERSSPSTIITF
jgi:hypothetical protein